MCPSVWIQIGFAYNDYWMCRLAGSMVSVLCVVHTMHSSMQQGSWSKPVHLEQFGSLKYWGQIMAAKPGPPLRPLLAASRPRASCCSVSWAISHKRTLLQLAVINKPISNRTTRQNVREKQSSVIAYTFKRDAAASVSNPATPARVDSSDRGIRRILWPFWGKRDC